jgi:hypothetical protein
MGNYTDAGAWGMSYECYAKAAKNLSKTIVSPLALLDSCEPASTVDGKETMSAVSGYEALQPQ